MEPVPDVHTADVSRASSTGAPLLGFWYPALTSREVKPGRMKAQVLVGQPLLICRGRDGRLAALRNICPHRAMPLSFGHFTGDRVECSYHGWQFDLQGRCRHIPALTSDSPIVPDKISVASYPCSERDGYIWIYIPDPMENRPPPDVPRLPVLSNKYRVLHISARLQCRIDDGIVGLMDPAHGPFVHNSAWWRPRHSIHEKAKVFEPLPLGFRMKAHAPSRNSGPYKLLGLSGTPITTTIDFILPNLRLELVQAGRYWFSSRATVTPLTEEVCRIDFCAAWNCFQWVPFSKTLVRVFARMFLNQDRDAMQRQALGLRYKPGMMLLDDADTPAKWYYKLKAAHLAARNGGIFDHPLKEPVTLRWRS